MRVVEPEQTITDTDDRDLSLIDEHGVAQESHATWGELWTQVNSVQVRTDDLNARLQIQRACLVVTNDALDEFTPEFLEALSAYLQARLEDISSRIRQRKIEDTISNARFEDFSRRSESLRSCLNDKADKMNMLNHDTEVVGQDIRKFRAYLGKQTTDLGSICKTVGRQTAERNKKWQADVRAFLSGNAPDEGEAKVSIVDIERLEHNDVVGRFERHSKRSLETIESRDSTRHDSRQD